MRKNTFAVVIASATTLLSAIACSSTTAPTDLIGTYTLTTVNGASVPYTRETSLDGVSAPNANSPSCQATTTEGTLTLSSSNQNFTLTYATTNSCNFSGAPVIRGGEGTYQIRGSVIDFRLSGADGVKWVGTLSQGKIDLVDSPLTLSFTR